MTSVYDRHPARPFGKRGRRRLALAVGTIVIVALAWRIIQTDKPRRGITKWSLYAACLLGPAICLSTLFTVWLGTSAIGIPFRPVGAAGWPIAFADRPQIGTVAMLYAAWWAAGVAANPYLARRGLSVWLVNFWIFLGVWLLLTFVVLAPNGLGELL